MDTIYRITETFKVHHCHNPLSGHKWIEYGKSTGYQVSGGKWVTTKHRTLTTAQKEVETRISLDKQIKELA